MAVSDVNALQRLAHGDPHIRLKALRALLYSTQKGNDRVVKAVLERLVQLDTANEHAGRAVAVEVLCHVAERGDMHVLQCLVQRLNEDTWRDDWFTRRAAVMTLCTLAEEGDVEHWNLLQRLMKLDPDWRVRLAALEALEAHVSPQTAEVIAIMLQDEQWRVRRASLTILVARRGDEHIVGEICRILEVSD